MANTRIYCSGPLFCAEEVGGMSAIAQVLEKAGYSTFLPHRDGLEPYVMRFGNLPIPQTVLKIRERIDYAIFCLDVYELIERCDAVVCNLNGRVPDEGMIVEAALAFAAGKPLVLFKDDARAPFCGYDNAMLTSLTHGRVIHKLNDVPAAVKQALAQKVVPAPLSEHLKSTLVYGKRLSSAMETFMPDFAKQRWSEEVLEQVLEAAFKA